jgi:mevalonate kinase
MIERYEGDEMGGKGTGFGKVILFGEHFVVYGLPAIASAFDAKTVATVSPSSKYELVDNRLETPGYKKEKHEEQLKSMEKIFAATKIDVAKTPLRIELGGDLVAASGVGASAASCTAIARALSEHFKLGLKDEQINAIAYEGEKGYHGTPSGIDNTVSTFGGLIWYIKGTPPIFEQIPTPLTFEIVVANTGITASTTEVVADVKKRKEEEPQKFERIFSDYKALAFDARRALEAGDLAKVGSLMNRNYALLQEIGVSCKELDQIVEIAMENGALGAKMTGTGRGGNAIALTPGVELQDKVTKALEKAGFEVLRTKIGVML